MKKVMTNSQYMGTRIPNSLWDAMSFKLETTGLSRSDQVRFALMTYLGITDLRVPFKEPNKEVEVTEKV